MFITSNISIACKKIGLREIIKSTSREGPVFSKKEKAVSQCNCPAPSDGLDDSSPSFKGYFRIFELCNMAPEMIITTQAD